MLTRVATGIVLRELRSNKGLTLRQMSGKANIALGYLSELENGKKEMSSEILENLSRGLETTPSSILMDSARLMEFTEIVSFSTEEEYAVVNTGE